MLSPPFNINKHFAIITPICDERLAVPVKSNRSSLSPLSWQTVVGASFLAPPRSQPSLRSVVDTDLRSVCDRR